MIYVLTGANDFARHERRKSLVSAFTKKYGDLAQQRIDGEEAEYAAIAEAIESLPFLSPKKLVVLSNPGANKDFVEHHKELLTDLSETTVLLIDEAKFDKRSSYYKFCKKLDGYEEFNELDSVTLQKWAQNYVKKWSASIEPQAAKVLVERLGTNQLRLANELDKLSMYSSTITAENVEELTVRTPTSTIFELIEAAFNNNKKRAIALYDEQRTLQVDPMQIIAMFTWQFHVLAIVKTAANKSQSDIAKEAKLNPYVVQKTERMARHLSLDKIKTNIAELRSIDEQLKSSRLNADDALKAFIISL